MKKTIIFVIMICLVLGFSGCKHKPTISDMEANNESKISESEYPFFETVADWPYYETIEELTNEVTDVYSGKVTDISFVLIDTTTNEQVEVNEVTEYGTLRLYTVYTVEIIDSLKGERKDSIKIKVNGGLIGYKEDEQYKIQESIGFSFIPVWDSNAERLEIGSEYVFCTIHSIGNFEIIPNPYQFAFRIDSANAKVVLACVK